MHEEWKMLPAPCPHSCRAQLTGEELQLPRPADGLGFTTVPSCSVSPAPLPEALQAFVLVLAAAPWSRVITHSRVTLLLQNRGCWGLAPPPAFPSHFSSVSSWYLVTLRRERSLRNRFLSKLGLVFLHIHFFSFCWGKVHIIWKLSRYSFWSVWLCGIESMHVHTIVQPSHLCSSRALCLLQPWNAVLTFVSPSQSLETAVILCPHVFDSSLFKWNYTIISLPSEFV